MKKLLFSIVLLCLSVLIFAQKAPMKFGKAPVVDVKMDVYPADSSADAVVLCEFGVFDDQSIYFYHQRRLKVITKEGLNQLIFNLPGSVKSDVRGFVYNMEEDGKVRREKISREHIFVERSGGRTSVRLAPPNVKEGSVLDIEYGYKGYPSIWQFQRTIPVRYSELRIPQNQNFSFTFQQIGYEPLMTYNRQHFYAENMPAFHAESYVNSINNYMTAILIDLTAVHYSNSSGESIYKDYCKDWGTVNRYFDEDESFGMRMDDACMFLSGVASHIKSVELDPRKRIDLAFQAIHNQVSWNGVVDMNPAVSLKEVWEDATGTSADMNFIFMALLKKLNIEVAPVVISSRSRGTVNPYYPTINRFNAMLSCALMPEGPLVIDASSKYDTPGTLPLWALNEGGLLVSKNGSEWLEMTAEKADVQLSSCQLKLDEDGNFEGNLSIRYSDYAANDFRETWDMYTSED